MATALQSLEAAPQETLPQKPPAVYALTLNQENYAQEYVFGHKYGKPGDKTAAFRASYSWENYTNNALWVKACQLYQVDKVRLRIEELQAELDKKYHLNAHTQLRKLNRYSDFDPRKLVDENGLPIPLQDLDEDTAKSIQELKVRVIKGKDDEPDEVEHLYKIPSRLGATDQENKHIGFYEADNQQKVAQIRVLNLVLEGLPKEVRESITANIMAKLGEVGEISQNSPISAVERKVAGK